jgi:hypothetical protein
VTSSETPAERQERLLRAEDGRYYAIDKFNTGLAAIATEEVIGGTSVGFGLPSGPALFLNLAYKAFLTYRDVDVLGFFDEHPPPQGRWPEDQKPLFDFCEQFAAHVVFAFTALESFANEVIPEGYTYTTTRGQKGQKITYNRDGIERNVSLSEKLAQILPSALGVKPPKGLHIWRDYTNLRKVRDRIIHLKMSDRSRTGPETPTIWGDMLRNSKEPFCDNAHKLMGYFGPVVTNRRWHKTYPYTRA